MARKFPAVTFERYVDDAVVHCESEARARVVVAVIAERMEQVGLRLHPEKTKVVYCQDGKKIVEDVKGYRTKEYKLKAKLFAAVMGFSIVEV